VANATCRSKRTQLLTVEEMERLVDQINALKNDLEEWKQDLPEYYEPIYIPSQSLDIDESVDLTGYLYESHLGYVACNNPLLRVTNVVSICRTHDELVQSCHTHTKSLLTRLCVSLC
jgi:hypothetical protein